MLSDHLSEIRGNHLHETLEILLRIEIISTLSQIPDDLTL